MAKKKIAVLCEQFFKMDGGDSLMGGGENYYYQLHELLRKNGYEPLMYQFSVDKWMKSYNNMKVVGLGGINPINPILTYEASIKKFEEETKNVDGYIVLSMNLMIKKYNKPTLTISHGIMFDGVTPNTNSVAYNNLEAFKTWIRNADEVITVDTNSKKLMQVWLPKLASKLKYIPNYANVEKFSPSELPIDEFNVLFPRRLQWCRGYTTMMKSAENLLPKYKDMKIYFVGRGNKMEEDHFTNWYNKLSDDLKNRVIHTSYEMNDMPKAYKNMHISVCPTIMAEGTSLACIESQASGVVPIVTCVGGLTDLVINEHNGLIIDPDDTWKYETSNSTYLEEAIEYLYNNRDEMERMRRNAIEVSKSFTKEKWDNRISKIIKEVFK